MASINLLAEDGLLSQIIDKIQEIKDSYNPTGTKFTADKPTAASSNYGFTSLTLKDVPEEPNRLRRSDTVVTLELKPSGPPSPTWANEYNFNAIRELTGNDDLALDNYWLPSVQQGLFPRTAFAAVGNSSFPVYNGEQGLLFDFSDLPNTGTGGENKSFLAATADLTRNKKSLSTVTLEAEILHNPHQESGIFGVSSSSGFTATVVPRDGNQIFTKSALRIDTVATTPSQFYPTRQYTVYVELNPMFTNFGFSTNTIFAADFEPGSWFSIKCILRKPLVEDPLNTFCTIVFNGQSFEIPYYLTDIPSETVREDMSKLFTSPEHYFAIAGSGGRGYPLIPGAGPLPASFSVRNLKYTFT